MDSRRLIVFIILSIGLLLLWEKYISPENAQTKNSLSQSVSNSAAKNKNASVVSTDAVNNQIVGNGITSLTSGKTITITTDLIQAQINTLGGDLTELSLLSHGSKDSITQPYKLFMNNDNRTFVTQTGLITNNGPKLPNHHTLYTTNQYNYTLKPGQENIVLNLQSRESGINIIKTYTFKRNSYVIDVTYKIENETLAPLSGVSAYWSILRDEADPEGETRFVHTFTGPVYYTTNSGFETLKFSNVNKGEANYPEAINNGWVGFIQHYFTTLWLLNATNYPSVCGNAGIACRLSFKPMGSNLVSAGVLTDLPPIAAHATYTLSMPLFAGPEDYRVLTAVAPHLELTRDYGWVYIFATPLFWLLVKLFEIVNNWGIAIILLTFAVKIILYPLTRAGYISMAKMKALAPKMEQLKKQYGEDRVKLQQAMMQLYKSEKVNPIGGCLPMILQVPVFIGLYWALLSSVELRYSTFLWIKDLSAPDPYYILPVILAGTMFLQTFLNPAPADPVQAKMMRIMPIAFSVMFFFFPAGLVVYWLTNNILSMAQQWYVNNHVTLRKQNRKK
ncbi:MAG: membrane protein insertase YidC [Burkholderiales bacterium]|nr:membrane protein insertase YidC [Burkholderiales bacterium]